ncbi:MAG: F5/8 type C domain protein [Spirochaetes bacterium ADurb.Bin218]|nr:MAG: F5/8 type C domain protein [Spirochaetes bacterium ADurb.Bin218]
MEFINICQRKYYTGKIHSFSSCESDINSPENLLKESGFWSTKKRSAAIHEYVIIDLGEELPVDYIRLSTSPKGPGTFPISFRLEYSNDTSAWSVLYSERDTSLSANSYDIDIPLTLMRYLKVLILEPAVSGSSYFAEIGRVEIGISGYSEVKASGWEEGCSPDNLFLSGDKCWEVKSSNDRDTEYVLVDLGKTVSINRIVLTSATDGFPEKFTIETSVDNEIWLTLVHETNFESEMNKSYSWVTGIRSARFVKLEAYSKSLRQGKKGIKIKNMEISAAPVNFYHTHTAGDITPHASVFHAGIVRLAMDGEVAPGKVVQSTDSRLREASTVFKGIVQFANDGESTEGLAVQSNDSRLQNATEQRPGIVRLAYNRETNPNAVVQSNDSRLQNATETNFGIVRLCPDGEYKEHAVVSGNDSRLQKATTESYGITKLAPDGGTDQGTVVQGNDRRLKDASVYSKGIVLLAADGAVTEGAVVLSTDRRLKDATISSKGIVELAEDGEDREGVVVQGNDRRLKDATTLSKGIVELAEDGEDREGVVVQGNDRRLKDATTLSKGIVELAEDGEDREGVVVQGNDRRLKDATEETSGIVRLAKNGEKAHGKVVQGDDERLSDKREPLPHSHDYAPINHDFSSHSGTIVIKDKKEEIFKDITAPSHDSSIIYANNISDKSHSVGITGIAGVLSKDYILTYGIVGHSSHVGVRGQSSGDFQRGAGVLGISRFGAGGLFGSEHDFALIADGYGNELKSFDSSIELKGEGKALFAKGSCEFHGNVSFSSLNLEYPGNIVEFFEADEAEFIATGDLLVASDKGKSILSRSSKSYTTAVIGVVSGNPLVVINNSGKEEKVYPVILAGKGLCRVDARQNPIKPGDLLVASDTPGCAMKGVIDSFDKIGSVIGKALDYLDDGIGLIPIFITHQ